MKHFFDFLSDVFLVSCGVLSALLGITVIILLQSALFDAFGVVLGVIGVLVLRENMVQILNRARR
jgi:hypothetical protein